MPSPRPLLIAAAFGCAALLEIAAAGAAQAQFRSQDAATAAPPGAADQRVSIPAAAPAANPAPAPHVDPAAPALPHPVVQKHVVHRRTPVRRVAEPLPISSEPIFTPQTVAATEAAAQRYGAIVRAGGWATIPRALRPGSRGEAVSALRHHLALVGDLDPAHEGDAPYNEVWDRDVTAAVKHFQARMGLPQTGIVSGETLKALNVPADERYQALLASAQRLSAVHFSFGSRYIVVNLPAASVEAVENGKVVRRYVAIVGAADHPSPEEIAHVQAVNLNPTWTLPVSIIKNEIIPKMRKDPAYLSREHIRVLDWHGKEIDPRSIDWNTTKGTTFMLRQDSGPGNALGSIRLNMPNRDAVYMHDTPSRWLFSRENRFLSHGCVRVQGVDDLAAWVLEGTPTPQHGVWDRHALLEGVASRQQEEIKLTKSVPVAWVYLTGWAGSDGLVQFRPDIYKLDTLLAEVPVASGVDPRVQAAR